jgi:hypothetical protein
MREVPTYVFFLVFIGIILLTIKIWYNILKKKNEEK